MQDPSGEPSAPTTVYVCVTCRSEGETDPVRSGRRLHDALAAAFGADPAIVLVPVECLSACRRPCTVSFAAPGKWTYVYADMPAEGAAPVVAEAARLYGATPDGLIPWKLRADPIKRGVVARVPPLGVPATISASVLRPVHEGEAVEREPLIAVGALPIAGQTA